MEGAAALQLMLEIQARLVPWVLTLKAGFDVSASTLPVSRTPREDRPAALEQSLITRQERLGLAVTIVKAGEDHDEQGRFESTLVEPHERTGLAMKAKRGPIMPQKVCALCAACSFALLF